MRTFSLTSGGTGGLGACALLLVLGSGCGVPPGPVYTSSLEPALVDADLDGVAAADDCDDQDEEVHPGAQEVCDGRDNDCDGGRDEGFTTTWYLDDDGDGVGNSDSRTTTCAPRPDLASRGGDCDDSSPVRHPGALEACDGLDNDCDGAVDEGLGAPAWRDADGDGYGTELDMTCGAAPGFVAVRGDCDDTDATRYPGADDPVRDSVDQDCGGTAGVDLHVGFSRSSATSIQAALDAAVSGMTVWVGPGTYLEHDLNFRGRAVALRSTHGAAATIIDARGQGRVFTFMAGEPPDTVLDGFTLTGGEVRGDNGGGLYLQGASPTIVGCVIEANTADGTAADGSRSGGLGGGVYLTNSSATISGCTVADNFAKNGSGGGLYVNDSSPSVSHCSISRNSAENGAGAGGVYIADSSPFLLDVTVSDNTASGPDARGAGLVIEASSPTMTYSAVTGNFLDSGNGGGGLFLERSSPALSFCTIADNNGANAGGGLAMVDSSPTLSHCTLSGNSAGHGGALALESSSPTITWGAFTGNNAYFGGAVYGGGGSIRQSIFTGNSAERGGALFLENASLELSRSTVAGNTATTGGGIYVGCEGSAPSLSNTIVAYNTSSNLFLSDIGAVDGAACGAPAPVLSYVDLYNSPGQPNVNLSDPGATTLSLEPGFLAYDAASIPTDLHLAPTSALIDAGDPAVLDAEGSRSDPGGYGGPDGGGWDRDRDGYYDYFWPGTLADVPEGIDPAGFDCDDGDGSRSQCQGE